MKKLIALVALLAGTASAQNAPRMLIVVTSVDQFANGRPTGVWLEEFATPYMILTHDSVRVTVVSPRGGPAPIDPRSVPKPDQEAAWKGAIEALHATQPLTAAFNANGYDAVFIPGGHGPLYDLGTDPAVAALISDFVRKGRPVASVCHGPAALLGVTLADGTSFVTHKKLTAFSDAEEQTAGTQAEVPYSVQQRLIALGAQYSQGSNFADYTVVDGQLITGQNPASSEKVAELLLARLRK
jgi:putative intracellular protease/amidase